MVKYASGQIGQWSNGRARDQQLEGVDEEGEAEAAGQIMVKYWSNNDQIMVKCGAGQTGPAA